MKKNFLNPNVLNEKFDREQDYQMWDVYNCEINTRHLLKSQKFNDIHNCREYIKNITGRKWFIDQFGKKFKIKVYKSNNNANAHYYTREIKLPEWAFDEIVILHEIAHLITPPPHSPHGALWANNYLNLVEYKLGSEEKNKLKKFFDDYKVKYTPFK